MVRIYTFNYMWETEELTLEELYCKVSLSKPYQWIHFITPDGVECYVKSSEITGIEEYNSDNEVE